MVSHPGDYPWSSYVFNAENKTSDLITPHDEFLKLGKTCDLRKRAYRGLFKGNMDSRMVDEIRCSTNGNFVLGSSRFKDEISAMLERRVSPGRAGRSISKS